MLVESILEEDRLLRSRLAQIPAPLRDARHRGGGLSFKETLSHIAYWDNFTVEFFANKLDRKSLDPVPPLDLEESSLQAMEISAKLPFGEVLARYLEATGALTQFLTHHWAELTPREKHDFGVPVKHRRQHRLSLFQALDAMQDNQQMAAEA